MEISLKSYPEDLNNKLSLNATYLACSLILLVIYKIVIRPLFRMHFYRKQGIPCSYFPLLGTLASGISSLKSHSDFKYYIKTRSKTSPAKIECSNMGPDASISLFDATLLRDYYQNTENYVKDPTFLELYSGLFGKGLITSEGNEWKKQRRILSNVFHFEFIKSVLPVIQSTTIEDLSKARNSSLNNVNVIDIFQSIAGQVVGKIFFGEQLNLHTLDGEPLTTALATLMSEMGLLNLSFERHLLGTWIIQKGIFPKHKKLMQKVKALRQTCRNIIEERKGSPNKTTETKDMLDLLLNYPNEAGKLAEEEIIDQFVIFFFAGMDTTGHLATIAAYCLDKYPEYKEKVHEEVIQHYHDNITMEDLNKLEFTMAFLKETLRMYTPAPGMFPRRAIKTHKLGEFTIREGDLVNFEFFYNNYNSTYFEEPDIFNPYRWLNKEKPINSFAFVPFSAGSRNCIGQHLSLIEVRIMLAEFLKRYDFKIREDFKLRMSHTFLYEPLDPILVNLVPKDI